MKIAYYVSGKFTGVFRILVLTAIISGISAAPIYGQQKNTSTTEKDASLAVNGSAEKKPAGAVNSPDKIKVTFDEKSPGVVIIESNGEKLRVDTNKRSVEAVVEDAAGVNSTTAQTQPPVKAKPDDQKGAGAYDFDKGEEPYDYRLINVPTPKSVPKGTWNLAFTHRFTQPIDPVKTTAKTLFGLDSFGIASFGISYGVTDKLFVSAYRSPLCQTGLCRVIELGAGYNFLTHDNNSPVALSAYASIEGNENFSKNYTYNFQARVSGRIGKRVYLFFSPAVHINANGQRRFDPRADDYFPPATIANSYHLPTHGASFGFGTAVMITPNVVATFEFTPRTGFKLGQVNAIYDNNFNVIGFTNKSEPEIGFGIQRNIGKHSFALTFSNTQTTTTSRYNSSNLVLSPKHLILGFNLARRF